MAHKIKILVCDDDMLIFKFWKELDSKMNMDIVSAESGAKAIELAKAQDIFCVFINSNLPAPGCYETFNTLKEQQPNLAIFIMITSANDPILEKCFKAGARGAVYKPPNMDKITSTIQLLEVQSFLKSELNRAMSKVVSTVEEAAKVRKISGFVKKTEEIEIEQRKLGKK